MAQVLPNLYSKGYIYKIVNDVNDEIYVGSSCNLMNVRMGAHRDRSKKGTSKFYRAIQQIGIDHFKIILVEEYPCDSKAQLNAREEYHRVDLKATYNTLRCFLTEEEFIKTTAEQRANYYYNNGGKEKAQAYRVENKEIMAARDKAYNESHIDQQRARHKLYDDNHRDERRESAKARRVVLTANLLSGAIIFRCDSCDTNFKGVVNLQRHMETKLHQDKLELNKAIEAGTAIIPIKDARFFCQTCCCQLKNAWSLSRHYTSKKHISAQLTESSNVDDTEPSNI